jgi:hypothetical protein
VQLLEALETRGLPACAQKASREHGGADRDLWVSGVPGPDRTQREEGDRRVQHSQVGTRVRAYELGLTPGRQHPSRVSPVWIPFLKSAWCVALTMAAELPVHEWRL